MFLNKIDEDSCISRTRHLHMHFIIRIFHCFLNNPFYALVQCSNTSNLFISDFYQQHRKQEQHCCKISRHCIAILKQEVIVGIQYILFVKVKKCKTIKILFSATNDHFSDVSDKTDNPPIYYTTKRCKIVEVVMMCNDYHTNLYLSNKKLQNVIIERQNFVLFISTNGKKFTMIHC